MTIAARDAFGFSYPVIYPGTSQDLAVGAASAQSSAVGASTSVIRVIAKTNDARIRIGANPTAVAADTLVKTGVAEYFAVKGGDKVAAIQDSAGGTLNITEGANF
jgi:hypothetical protein